MNQVYLDTARLLTQVAPLVFADNVFALKGGTAINLFVCDVPRLSVDAIWAIRTPHPIDVVHGRDRVRSRAFQERFNRARNWRRGSRSKTARASDACKGGPSPLLRSSRRKAMEGSFMSLKIKHWQDPVSLLAGVWMVMSPWVLAYQTQSNPMWNAVAIGALIAAVSFTALFESFAWQEWANVLLGAWLIASPWALGFSALQVAMLNAVIVGAVVAGLAIWALGTDRDIGGWFSPAH